MIVCPSCRNNIPINVTYCPYCGSYCGRTYLDPSEQKTLQRSWPILKALLSGEKREEELLIKSGFNLTPWDFRTTIKFLEDSGYIKLDTRPWKQIWISITEKGRDFYQTSAPPHLKRARTRRSTP